MRLAAVVLTAWLAATPAAAQPRALEQALKAAFLTKFAAFVVWPSGQPERVRLCVVGDDPLGAALDQAAAAAGAVTVRRMAAMDDPSACDIAFLTGSKVQPVGAALEAVGDAPVLTVTDAARGPSRGAIHFVVFERRVRFHIDAAQVGRGGLSMSSKLMALGLSVKR